MTGLGGPGSTGDDTLLEVAALATNGAMDQVIEGPEIVIHHPDEVLGTMNDWCKTQFKWNDGKPLEGGLAKRVQESKVSLAEADEELAAWVSRAVAAGERPVLAGNTVHMDKRFLERFLPRFSATLHYRIVDVSTVKELCRRWYPHEFSRAGRKRGSHRAKDDILESIEELKFYKANIFKP